MDEATCRSCGAQRPIGGDDWQQRLRAAGWHIYEGPTIGGGRIEDIICDQCAHPGRNRKKPIQPEQETLWTT